MSELNYLAHYGVKGQKYGVRQYQNLDGSLTPLGRVHYGVGEARKKASATAKKVSGAVKKAPNTAGKIIRNAPKNISKAAKSAVKSAKKTAKKTVNDLSKQRKEAVEASKKRRQKAKAERAKQKEIRRKEKAEKLTRKIVERESKKRLADLKDEFEQAKINDAKKRIDALVNKQNRIQEKAYLKEQEKALKRSMKKVKADAARDAKRQWSRKEIMDLSDEELAKRKARLKAEIELAQLEFERSSPTLSAGSKWVVDTVSKGASIGVQQLAGAAAVRLGKNALGLTDEEISEYIRLTKKK